MVSRQPKTGNIASTAAVSSCRFAWPLFPAEEARESLVPPLQPDLSAGQGGLTSLPIAVGEPVGQPDPVHLLAGSAAAGNARAGHPSYATPATSPAPWALTLGRAT